MKLQYEGLEKFNCKKVLLSKSVTDSVILAGDKLRDVFMHLKPSERIILDSMHSSYTYHNLWVTGDILHVAAVFQPGYIKIGGDINLTTETTNFWGEGLDRLKQKEPDLVSLVLKIIITNLWTEAFLQFAEVEVKELKPNRQIYEGVICLYNNKTKSDIQIIDSTWFTTLVKSDEFKVRGHFRLQPCGEGMAKRKLIWVSEFKKSGYTREAKKLKEFPTI